MQDQSKHPVYVRTGSGNFYDGVAFRYSPYWATPEIASPIGGTLPLQTVRDGRLGDRLINTNYRNFAPRFGIAWSPSDKWSVRTGFGIFYSEESKNSIFDFNRGMGGRTGQLAATTYGEADVQLHEFHRHVIASGDPAHRPHLGRQRDTCPTSSSMQYMLNVQRTLGQGDDPGGGLHRLAEAATWHYLTNQNQGILNASLPSVQRLPYPEWGASGIQWLNADGNRELQRPRRQTHPAFRQAA